MNNFENYKKSLDAGEFVKLPNKVCDLLKIPHRSNPQLVAKQAAYDANIYWYFSYATIDQSASECVDVKTLVSFLKEDRSPNVLFVEGIDAKSEIKVIKWNLLEGLVPEDHPDFYSEIAFTKKK